MNIQRKPEWLRKKVNPSDQTQMRKLLAELRLNTVCQHAMCPNISECFASRQATFLILGRNCTRQCSFCNIEKKPPVPADPGEPARVAEAVTRLALSHVVITSPTRDDLSDGGSGLYAATVKAVHEAAPTCRIELLIPDFMGSRSALEAVVTAHPDIIAHNLETVPRLYHIRSGADYFRSLELLRLSNQLNPGIAGKSGIMLGMGEELPEVIEVLKELRATGCVYLSIGQYLAPSRNHYPVQEYVVPDLFQALRETALELGFSHVESGPYVRSSYHADHYRCCDTFDTQP